MITLRNVKKRFSNQLVLSGINYTFPSTGFFAICGPSGCGKTTLLNVIASLHTFDGEVEFAGEKYENLNESSKCQVRNKKIGFVFQDCKLFEFDSVESNIKLALDLKTNDSRKIKEKRIKDLLSIVGLKDKEKEIVGHLSGGEKQRVAIARAICNNPKVILADEPTGNLDNKNGKAIMDLLQKISKTYLVVVVTHDEELAKQYVSTILYMKDGKIISEKENVCNYNEGRLSLIKLKSSSSSAKLPLGFCFNHTINNIKKRKWRTLLIVSMCSLGLMGVGLGTVIKDIISINLYNSYSSIIDDDSVVVTPKVIDTKKNMIYAADLEEITQLKEDFKTEVIYDGIYYQNNFINFYNSYSFSLDLPIKTKLLPSYTPQFFNDYLTINECEAKIECWDDNELENNEIIIGVTPGLLNEICFQLQIPRTVESFINYLSNNRLNIDVYLENENWQFFKEFSLTVEGFAMTNIDCFIHTSNYWNKYIFETLCNFSITNIINSNTSHPWDLKSVPYLYIKDIEPFLKEIKYNKRYSHIVAEILTDEFYPVLMSKTDIEDCHRIALYMMDNKDQIPLSNYPYLKESSKYIRSAMVGSEASYVMYPNNLMMGFAKQTIISTDSNYLENVIDITSYIKTSEDKIINVPKNVIMGHFAKSDGLRFSCDYKLNSGILPRNYSEIVISSALTNALNFKNPINRSLYLCFPKTEDYLPNGYIKRNYIMTSMKIVGVSNSNKLEINHNEEWPILFFQTKLKISSFSLSVNAISLSIEEGHIDDTIKTLNKAFPNFNAISPISGVKESVESICKNIETILAVLSISSLVISAILLSICNYIHFVEIKKDIGLAQCLGVNKKESKKLIYTHSFVMSGLSFLISVFELFFICIVLTKSLSVTMGAETVFVFNPMSIVYMFLLCFGISHISSFFISTKLNKYSALECLNS